MPAAISPIRKMKGLPPYRRMAERVPRSSPPGAAAPAAPSDVRSEVISGMRESPNVGTTLSKIAPPGGAPAPPPPQRTRVGRAAGARAAGRSGAGRSTELFDYPRGYSVVGASAAHGRSCPPRLRVDPAVGYHGALRLR